jgi:hypothetical protein
MALRLTPSAWTYLAATPRMATSSGSGEAETREACYSDQHVSLFRRDCKLHGEQNFVYDYSAGTFEFAKDQTHCLDLDGGRDTNGTLIELW